MTAAVRNRRRRSEPPGTPRRRLGFTLIEIMAVMAIIAMIFAIGAPRLGGSRWRVLHDEAEAIAASLEFARQRAVMTGTPHRLLIDLEQGGYRIEWLVSEDRAFEAVGGGDSLPAQLAPFDSSGDAGAGSEDSLDLRPPTRTLRDYYPIPNRRLGSFSWLDDALYFVGLDSTSGWIEGGDVAIVFEADGTTEHSLLEIADHQDRHLTLQIEPMLERVRRRDGAARS